MKKNQKDISEIKNDITSVNDKQPIVVLTSVVFHNVNEVIPFISKQKDSFRFEERDNLTRRLTRYINEGFNLSINDFEQGNEKLEESIIFQIIMHTDALLYKNHFQNKRKMEKWVNYFKDHNIKAITNWSFVNYIAQGKIYLDIDEWDTAIYNDYISYINNRDNFDFTYLIKWK